MKNIEMEACLIIEEIYKEYYSVIFRYIICRIKCKHDAEDLVQDVFVHLLDYDKMLQKSTIRSFLFTITRNIVIDYLKISLTTYRVGKTSASLERFFKQFPGLKHKLSN